MLTDGDFVVRLVNLPGSVHGALREDSEGFGNIYINEALGPAARRRAFDHEVLHLVRGDLDSDRPIEEVENCRG